MKPSELKSGLILLGYSETSANIITGQHFAGQPTGTEPATVADVKKIAAKYAAATKQRAALAAVEGK